MISAAVALFVGLLGLGFKLWLANRKSTAQKAVDIANAMAKDAVNRTEPADVTDDMRRGDF